jgi:cyclopropane fatty-acyl-phospholipid synthase-like methyltransferase
LEKRGEIKGSILDIGCGTGENSLYFAGLTGLGAKLMVTSATRIKVGGKKTKLDELASQMNKAASVKFLPTRSGNVAQSIEIGQ